MGTPPGASPHVGFPQLANKNTGSPDQGEFQINSEQPSSRSMTAVCGGRAQEEQEAESLSHNWPVSGAGVGVLVMVGSSTAVASRHMAFLG